RCGVSAFGFGGTNFHVVMEEYIPGRIKEETKIQVSSYIGETEKNLSPSPKKPLRGAYVRGGSSLENLVSRLENELPSIQAGNAPAFDVPDQKELQAPHRIAIDYKDAEELASKIERA
ncbi:hypothetical protein RZS08_47975, partial [Arthrospira platensis SPKY1]|nr:hypothetical protein [Arthrospira platensis SPKY1]